MPPPVPSIFNALEARISDLEKFCQLLEHEHIVMRGEHILLKREQEAEKAALAAAIAAPYTDLPDYIATFTILGRTITLISKPRT